MMLVDCDDVILSWKATFDRWIYNTKGLKVINHVYDVYERFGVSELTVGDLIQEFNHTHHFGTLPPLHDAVAVMNRLFDNYGMTFVVISSCDTDLIYKRERNLHLIFGDRYEVMFPGIILAGHKGCKRPHFEKFKDTGMMFVDDHPRNIIAASEFGLNPILFVNEVNYLDEDMRGFEFAFDWKDIEHKIKHQYDVARGTLMNLPSVSRSR